MNNVDIAILIVLLLGSLNGLRVGFIQSLSHFIGWLLALFCAIQFYEPVSLYLGFISQQLWLQQVVAFIAIVCAVMLGVWFLSGTLQQLFKMLKLTPLNRIAGGVFGALKSAVILLILMQTLSPWLSAFSWWQGSKLITHLSPYAPLASKWSQQMSQKVAQQLNDAAAQTKAENDASIATGNGDVPLLNLLFEFFSHSNTTEQPAESKQGDTQRVKNPFSP
ncbi:MAG: CvpA family protein [Acinetobacter sp.]|nr:CvpA family protein [Acinetobacter sp.]